MLNSLPTIPEYYKKFIDKDVDLRLNPKQCCPFHKEDTPSFSYSAEREVWRCFGACKCGGDVIALHQKLRHIQTRKEAKQSLESIYGIKQTMQETSFDTEPATVNSLRLELEMVYQKALILANKPERWIELDYAMSKYPVEAVELEALVQGWTLKTGG